MLESPIILIEFSRNDNGRWLTLDESEQRQDPFEKRCLVVGRRIVGTYGDAELRCAFK